MTCRAGGRSRAALESPEDLPSLAGSSRAWGPAVQGLPAPVLSGLAYIAIGHELSSTHWPTMTIWRDLVFGTVVVVILAVRARSRLARLRAALIEGKVTRRAVWLSIFIGESVLYAITLTYLLLAGATPEDVGVRQPDATALLQVSAILAIAGLAHMNMHARQRPAQGEAPSSPSLVQARAMSSALRPQTPLEWMAWSGVSLIVAVSEELFFRGFLYTSLARATSIPVGLVLSSLAFGFVHAHYHWKMRARLSLTGLALGALFILGDGLLLPTVMHLFLNVSVVARAGRPSNGVLPGRSPWPAAQPPP